MESLAAAALFFVGIHLLIAGTPLRAALVARMGERGYLGLFSLLSAAGLTWLIVAFVRARLVIPTALLDWRWLALLLNFVALTLIAFGVLVRGPTAVGGSAPAASADPARGMHRITRHPMLWGFALWAGVHMVFNPQPPALVFFGAFLVLALIGPRSIDARRAARDGEGWARYAAVTSNVPFAAVLSGRNRIVWSELVAWPLFVGAAATEIMVLAHAQLFGVAAL